MPDVSGIHHVSVTVTDIERSVPWYSELLGLTKLMEEPHPDGTGYTVVLGKPDWSMCVGLHTHPTNERERFSESRTGLDHIGFIVSGRAGSTLGVEAHRTRSRALAGQRPGRLRGTRVPRPRQHPTRVHVHGLTQACREPTRVRLHRTRHPRGAVPTRLTPQPYVRRTRLPRPPPPHRPNRTRRGTHSPVTYVPIETRHNTAGESPSRGRRGVVPQQAHRSPAREPVSNADGPAGPVFGRPAQSPPAAASTGRASGWSSARRSKWTMPSSSTATTRTTAQKPGTPATTTAPGAIERARRRRGAATSSVRRRPRR